MPYHLAMPAYGCASEAARGLVYRDDFDGTSHRLGNDHDPHETLMQLVIDPCTEHINNGGQLTKNLRTTDENCLRQSTEPYPLSQRSIIDP